MIQSINWY